MNNEYWKSIDDADFDVILKYNVPEMPPEDIVTEVTPWKKAMNHILIGLTLTSVTLSFCGLNYILPAIGMLCLLLGFRALREENKWFKSCFYISIIRTIHFLITLIMNSTIYFQDLESNSVDITITIVLKFLFLFCFWCGFRQIQQKVDFSIGTGSALALMFWNFICLLLAFVQYSGYIIFAAIILCYIFIIRNIYQLSNELDEAGYAIQTTQIKISDRTLTLGLIALLLLGCICGYIFGNSYHMNWEPLNSQEHAGVEEIKQNLINLGFPEDILNDLSAEDIEACEGAIQVVVDVDNHLENDAESSDGAVHTDEKIEFTRILVAFPAKQNEWRVFHHFRWTTNPCFRGTECIQLWPADRNSDKCNPADDISGRVLYDKDQTSYAAQYYSLEKQTYTSDHWAFGPTTQTDYFANFSLPDKGLNHRGYVAYSIKDLEDRFVVSSCSNYIHQESILQYPVKTAMVRAKSSAIYSNDTFNQIQDILNFSTDEDGNGEIEGN